MNRSPHSCESEIWLVRRPANGRLRIRPHLAGLSRFPSVVTRSIRGLTAFGLQIKLDEDGWGYDNTPSCCFGEANCMVCSIATGALPIDHDSDDCFKE